MASGKESIRKKFKLIKCLALNNRIFTDTKNNHINLRRTGFDECL